MLRYCLALVFSGVLTGVWASDDATIDRVEMSPMDVTAMARGRLDLNNEQCALVKVNVLADDVVFQGNVVGDVPRYGGEHWVYMIDGTKELRFQSLKFRTVRVYFPDWGIPHLEGGVTYTVDVSLPELTPVTGSLNINYLPAGATITLDGKSIGSTPDVFDNIMIGAHTVTISHPDYSSVTLPVAVSENQLATLEGKLSKKPKQEINISPSQPLPDPSYSSPENSWEIIMENGVYGYADQNGQIMISPEYDYCGEFNEGYAPVMKVESGIDKWGFIDRTGKIQIPYNFDEADVFSEGLAGVRIRDKWGYISHAGMVVIRPQYDRVYPFDKTGVAKVIRGNRIFHINKKG